eukprot:c3519_g1_i1.p1 GENE.c3519_g1_i1~~c3519_g1_i1.p1  ORF type:complete len:366 (+),score=71.21 c3519_g1_i1:26-1099(+)
MSNDRWLPPGAEPEHKAFEEDFEEHFYIPPRLLGKNASLVTAVNDFHFAMMNDVPRNEFYRAALQSVVPGKIVLEIGAGSGLLSMIAAQAGAAHVYAVEASSDMVHIAKQIIEANGLSKRITVVNMLSSDVTLQHIGGRRAEVLVSEILGTMLLGEGSLDYVSDARHRLLIPDAVIIPACGVQSVTLIESREIESITKVQGWGGFDLSKVNQLQDTVSNVFSKQYGFRMSSIPFRTLSPRISVQDVDFHIHHPGCFPLESRIRFRATESGVAHAFMFTWHVFSDRRKTHSMSTDPAETLDNFPRDMQWGQALQLVENHLAPDNEQPQPFIVQQGQEYDLLVTTSRDSVVLQLRIEPV